MEKDYISDSWNVREKKAEYSASLSPFCVLTVKFGLDR